MTWKTLLRPGVRELASPREREHPELGRDLVRLDLNEGALQPDASEMALFQLELAKLDLSRYPEASGRALRERLAQCWKVEPDEILLGNGSVETIGILMTAFGGPQAGEPASVIHPDPTYGQYEIMASGYGLRAVPVPLGTRFELDEARVAAAIERERPALAFYPSPNSPTGNCFPHDSLERLARRLGGVFVVDEAYADFAGQSIVPRIRSTPGLFVMRSLSKIGLAGLRVGALIGEREAIAELDKVRLPFNVNAVSLALATSLLAQPQRMAARIEAIVRLRRALELDLRSVEGATVLPSQANFVLVRTPYAAHVVFDRLLARGVLVRVFANAPRLARCLRITAGTPLDNARCVSALREVLAELSGERTPAVVAAAS